MLWYLYRSVREVTFCYVSLVVTLQRNVQWFLAMLLASLKFLTRCVLSVNRWMKICQATAAETALAGMVWTEVLSPSSAFKREHLVRFALWCTDMSDMAKHLTL